MNLVLHQLRLELRRASGMLVLYALLLACNLAVVVGWVGLKPPFPGSEYWGGQGILPALLMIGFWALFAKLAVGCVLADAPARRDRFLATRPMPARPLYLAKALYIVLAVVLPAVLLEMISLRVLGAGPGILLAGGWERFLLLSTTGFTIALFAAHWKNLQGLLFGSVLLFVFGSLLANLLLTLFNSLSRLPAARVLNDAPTFLAGLQGLATVAAGLAVTAWLRNVRGWRFRSIVPSFALVALAGLLVAGLTEYRRTNVSGVEQATIDRLLADGELTTQIHPMGITFAKYRTDTKDMQAAFEVQPVANGFPADWELRWRSLSDRWTAGDAVLQDKAPDRARLANLRIASHANRLSGPLAAHLRKYLGSEVSFSAENSGDSVQSLATGRLIYPPTVAIEHPVASVKSSVAADAFRWSVVADLPVADADQASLRSRQRWSLVEAGASDGVYLHLIERGPRLHTTGDFRSRRDTKAWQNQYRFALYLPTRNLVWFGRSRHENEIVSISSASHSFGTIEFSDMRGFFDETVSNEVFNEGRLIILGAEYLGRFTTEFTSDEFALVPNVPEDRSPNPYGDEDKIEPAEYARWFKGWDKVSPTADARKVAPHLDRLFDQMERREYYFNDQYDPSVHYLATFVPNHLELILERMPRYSQIVRRAIQFALTRGATPEQSSAIVAALPTHPTLLEVADQRGWTALARDYLVSRTKVDSRFASQNLPALLSLDDPSLDPLLLSAFERNPDAYAYELLRRVPRIAAQTEEIASGIWEPGRLVVNFQQGSIQPSLSVALSQGRPEALSEYFEMLQVLPPESYARGAVARVIPAFIRLPEELETHRHDEETLLEWLDRYSATDFVFDPVFRQFVLKPSANTI